MHAPNDYLLLTQRFAKVRRAWKRTAALSGLAVVATEAVGLFTALLFLDWLYQPQPFLRLTLWAIALGGLGWLTARQVVKPLLRKISDDQIALYIEEHRSELDGVLITATEFHRKRDAADGRQNALIDAVIREASQRSAKMSVTHLTDFSRLKKYGIGALGGIGAYVLLAVLFPSAFGNHVGRVLAPWHPTEEDVAKHAVAVALAEPMRFTLSKGDASLVRGSSYDFEATLSKTKPAGQAILLNFRPKAGGDWQKLPMTEIDKLNGFQGALADVSEDLEFYVSCGADKSPVFKLTAYDPLVVQSMETTTHYPDYVKLPDAVVNPSTGDVTALVGSTVTFRFLTSTTLKEGQIKWNDGKTQSVTVDPQATKTATVSFPVTGDGTFDYTITDVNGQQATSAAPLSIHAVPDNPPTIAIKSPQPPVITNPLGEINFEIEAGDDFGVVGLELVYSRIDAKGNSQDTRVPLTTKTANIKDLQNAVTAVYRLALEDINPPFQPNDAIPFHVEGRDAKGQLTSSPIGMIIVGEFEHWGTWLQPVAEPKGGAQATAADLMKVLAEVWELDNQKAQIKPDELQKRSKEIAGKIKAPDGTLTDFINLMTNPQLAKIAPVINDHITKAHAALIVFDTTTASTQLSIAAAILVGNGIKLDAELAGKTQQAPAAGSPTTTPPALTMLEQARLTALSAAAKSGSHDEKDSTANADTAKNIADLSKAQTEVATKAQSLADSKESKDSKDGKDAKEGKSDQAKGSSPAAGEKGTGKAPDAKDLAAQQHAIADKTRAAAAKTGAAAGSTGNAKLKDVAEKTNDAARLMEEASRAFATGKNGEGKDKANQANAKMLEITTSLQSNDRNKLAAAIDKAQTRAAVLTSKQKDLNAKTDALAKGLGGKAPDQGQKRDLQKAAFEQTKLAAEAEALKSEVGRLNDWAAQVGQGESVQAMTEAQKVMKRAQPHSKLASAAVDLNNGNAASASAEQKNAMDSLEKLGASLQAGSDALGTSREAQLNRANRMASEAKKSLASLQGKGKGTGKDPAKDAGKDPAKEPGKEDKGTADSNDGNGGNSREDQAKMLAYHLTKLAEVTDNRQLVAQDQVDQLKQLSMDKAELEKRLLVDPKLLQDVSKLVATISDKIEAELEAKTEEGKLNSSQREECPPSYRVFVNQYFEALSQVAPARSAKQSTPDASGQPQ